MFLFWASIPVTSKDMKTFKFKLNKRWKYVEKLTESQIQYIIELLQEGKNIPVDYKNLLFPPEKQEYELTYAGKERKVK